MRRALGYGVETGPELPGGQREEDTFTCCHCGSINTKPPFKATTDDAIGAWCTCCDAAMCLSCVGKGCRPLQRWIARMEARRSYEDCAR